MRVGFRLASCALPILLGFLRAGCASTSWLETMAFGEKVFGEKVFSDKIFGEKPAADGQDALMRVAADIESQGQIAAALPIYERAAATSNDTPAQLRLGD